MSFNIPERTLALMEEYRSLMEQLASLEKAYYYTPNDLITHEWVSISSRMKEIRLQLNKKGVFV
jgi:hypothetical protein